LAPHVTTCLTWSVRRRLALLLFPGGSLAILLGTQTTLEIGKTIEARLGDGESLGRQEGAGGWEGGLIPK
jgi:hypothetical protein